MILNRKEVPIIQQATNFSYDLPPIDTFSLGNNLKLYSLNAGTQPVLSFEVYIPKEYNRSQDVAISKATTALMKSGTSKLTALQIDEQIEQVGASFSISQNNDYFIVRLKCLSKHFKGLLPLLFEVIHDTQFPEHEVEIYRKQAIQHLTINLKKSDFVANRTIDELIYGFDHPYGMYAVVADYQNLKQHDILNYYKENVSLANAKFFLSGRFDDQLPELIKQQLEIVNGINGQTSSDAFSENPNPELKHRIKNDENALQGAIRIGKKFVSRSHEDFIPMLYVNTLFGGYFGSRLMSNIREEKGYTYGIYSFVQQNKHSNSYIIATDVHKDVAEAATEEVWHEMERLKNEPVGEDELQLVKNYILGSILGSIDGPFKIMGRWKSIILNERDKSHFDRNIETFKTIDAQQVQALANKYYNREDYYDLIVF